MRTLGPLAATLIISASNAAGNEPFSPPDGFSPTPEYVRATNLLSVASTCRAMPRGGEMFDKAFEAFEQASQAQEGGPNEAQVMAIKSEVLSVSVDEFATNPFAMSVCSDLQSELLPN